MHDAGLLHLGAQPDYQENYEEQDEIINGDKLVPGNEPYPRSRMPRPEPEQQGPCYNREQQVITHFINHQDNGERNKNLYNNWSC
jgi:hypothetical protein